MPELTEEELSARWVQVADQTSLDWKESLDTYRTEQPELWVRWAEKPPEVVAIGIQLSCAASMVLAFKDKPAPGIEEPTLLNSVKRFQSLQSFLLKRLGDGESLESAFNLAGEKFPLRQWALIGLIAESLLDEIEQTTLTAADGALVFSELAIQIDALDRAPRRR